ncbi:hypothetical protein SH2C18_34190 [Clostridium sediminicola]|uniref:hypothetical protein n=1 Tax=Clostridium sediminicola TaxID=3114879 RepID=UPI0031F27DF4
MGKKEKFSIVLISILLISNLLLFKMLSKVDNKIMDIQYQNVELREDIDSISKNVNDSVKEFTDEQRWLKLESMDIINFSDDLKEANVKIKWSLRELNKGDKVYLIYGCYDDDPSEIENWDIVLVDKDNTLNYEEKLSLNADKNYYFKVKVKNSSKTIIENLTNIELNKMIEDRIQIQTYFKSRSTTNIDMYINLVNDYLIKNNAGNSIISDNIIDKLKIRNIWFEIFIGDEEVIHKDIIKDGIEEIEGLKIENPYGLEIVDYNESMSLNNDIKVPGRIKVYIEDYLGNKYEEIFDDR